MRSLPKASVWDKAWQPYNKKPFFKPNHKVIEEVKRCFPKNLKGKKILELGAGSACDIINLTLAGAEGYALDFSKESFKAMNYWAKEKNVKVKIVLADIKKIPFKDNTFDCIYSVGLMEHFPDPIPYLHEQIRLLKPGGFLIIDVPQTFTLYTIAKNIRMRLGTHPFGWETQFTKFQMENIAKKLNQPIHRIYGRDSDIILRIPDEYKSFKAALTNAYRKSIEKSFISPYVSICIGLVLKINKQNDSLKILNKKMYPEFYGKPDKCMLAYRETIKKFANNIENSKILDVGCGLGNYTALFAHDDNKVTGLDIKDHRDKAYSSFYKHVVYNGKKFPFPDNTFDYVINFDVIEHIPHDELFVREMKRVLKKGGKTVVATPNKNRIASILLKMIGKGDVFPKVMQEEGVGGKSVHEREYTTSELAKLFADAGYKKIRVDGCWMGIRGNFNLGTNKFVIPAIAHTLFLQASK
jgi:ubiquinone/menaquinone biosynthesis C-methylase UbiE